MWSTQDLHCSTRTFWKWLKIQQLIPQSLEFGVVLNNCHLILRNMRNFPLQVVDLRSISLWKQVLQFEPHLPNCLIVHDAATDINVHRVDQPWKYHGVAALPILIKRWINFWHWNLDIHKANFLLGSESKHHCSWPRVVVSHAKQGLSDYRMLLGFSLELRKYGLRALDSLLEFVFGCVDWVLWGLEGASISKEAIEGPRRWEKELSRRF